MQLLLLGNPNSGKTTFFNRLSRSRAKVANYPGVTVESARTSLRFSSQEVELVDLPGTYSLSARSPDEQVAVSELLEARKENEDRVAVVVVDVTALERGLYLALQVIEFGIPTVVALTMSDAAEKAGMRIDKDMLPELLGVPVVDVSIGRTGSYHALLETLEPACLEALRNGAPPLPDVPYSEEVLARADGNEGTRGDKLLATMNGPGPVQKGIVDTQSDDVLAIVSARYCFLEALHNKVQTGSGEAWRRTAAVDRILLHPLWGLLAFIGVMALIFELLFSGADPAISLIESGVALLQEGAQNVLPPGFIQELVVNGMLAGVGNVIVFVPQIALLFLMIGFLEDSGYLARVAFVIDRVMARVGLSGNAFVPFLSGFACAVPAIAATRTLESRRDRLVTMLAIPLTACSARLPIFVLVSAILFASEARVLGLFHPGALALLLMYLVSAAAALGAAWVMRRTVLRGPRPAYVLALPPYRLPTLLPLVRTTARKVMLFLKEAGTVILGFTLLLWVLLSFPKDPEVEDAYQDAIAGVETGATAKEREARVESIEEHFAAKRVEASVGGRIGKTIEPVLEPLGFDWRLGVAILGAFSAREVFVSTLGIIFGHGDSDEGDPGLRATLQAAKRPDGSPLITLASGLSLLVFFMFACQCMSTVAAVYRESESIKWPAFLVTYMTSLAYLSSFITYQVLR